MGVKDGCVGDGEKIGIGTESVLAELGLVRKNYGVIGMGFVGKFGGGVVAAVKSWLVGIGIQ